MKVSPHLKLNPETSEFLYVRGNKGVTSNSASSTEQVLAKGSQYVTLKAKDLEGANKEALSLDTLCAEKYSEVIIYKYH